MLTSLSSGLVLGHFKKAAIVSTTALLIACGGGGGSGTTGNGNVPPSEDLPSISIQNASLVEGDSGQQNLRFAVSLSAVSEDDIAVDFATSDGTATAGVDYISVSDTLSIPAGNTSVFLQVAIVGDTTVEPDETFTLTLSDPINAELQTATATGTINNDDVDTPVESNLSIGDVTALEGNTGATDLSVTVTVNPASSEAINLDVATTDGSAEVGSDYTEPATALTIPAGASSATITIPILGDTDEEPDETFTLTIGNATAGVITQGSAVITIVNDDTGTPMLPELSLVGGSVIEGDSGQTDLIFTLSVQPAAVSEITVQAATADGSALAGEDFLAIDETLVIPAGTTSWPIAVAVLGDTADEPDETLSLILSNPTNAVIQTASAAGTITSDDAAVLPEVSVSGGSVNEGDSGQADLVFTLDFTPVTTSDIGIDIATTDGTAIAGEDYTARAETITVPAGTASFPIAIAVSGDVDIEDDETLTLTLSNPVGVTVQTASATGTIVNDDVTNPSELTISNATLDEGDSGRSEMVFTVAVTPAAESEITVLATTSDTTAVAGDDYEALSSTITIPIGATSAEVAVPILGDTTPEDNETFTVTLSDVVGGTLSTATAVGTITDDDPLVFGIATRPTSDECIAPDEPTSAASFTTSVMFAGAALNQPTKILLEPVTQRWFILLREGEIVVFDNDADSTPDVWLDMTAEINSAGEGGLLGMAFHPDYPSTPVVYLSYTTGTPMTSVVTRVEVDDATAPVNIVEDQVIAVNQPFQNHNGGDIAFGPDDYLYIGLGDGGGSGDSQNHAQNTTDLLGSILRLDVLDPSVSYPTTPYIIPADNPFAGNALCAADNNNSASCPEIFAWGFRNPFRWNFDHITGQLWVGDVGQDAFEEVDLVELGGNYGWRCLEGFADYNFTGCSSGYQSPVLAYGRDVGQTVTGGLVYRGSLVPSLYGKYVFGDYGTGRIWAITESSIDNNGDVASQLASSLMTESFFGPTSFATDASGEIVFTDIKGGQVRKIVPASITANDTVATLLSQTGCVDATDPTQPASDMIPYTINAPFWSDGAVKTRYMAVPGGETITLQADGDFDFPIGSVLMKNFRLNGQLVETRLMMHHTNGNWRGYSYEWNAEQTEATRVDGGKTAEIQGQTYTWPSSDQCTQCHTSIAGFALGPEIAELNGDFTYPASGTLANQLFTLDHIGMFSTALPDSVFNLDALADPNDTNADINDRARAWLHSNCSQCHRDGGPTPVSLDFRYTTALSATGACDVAPSAGDLGIVNARIIAPGEASRSVLINRISRRDASGMPPIGSHYIDSAGVAMLTQWIDGLASCQ